MCSWFPFFLRGTVPIPSLPPGRGWAAEQSSPEERKTVQSEWASARFRSMAPDLYGNKN